VVSLGFDADGKRVRRKVSGKTKAEVKDKLKALHSELDAGLRTAQGYTVEKAVADWLEEGLPGRTAKTVEANRDSLRPLLAVIGRIPMRDLTAQDVRTASPGFPSLGGVVVAGADDQVARTGLGAVGDADSGSVADDAEGDEVRADAAVQLAPQRVAGGHEERIGASGGQGGVGGRGGVHRLLRVAAVDAAVLVVLDQHGGIAVP
jgi:hypothetical protein